jgi:lysophospholipase L1-like esterase
MVSHAGTYGLVGPRFPGPQHGDHLHPNDAGYQAMADAVDARLFR